MFYLFTTLVDLPNATDFLASTTDWSSPIFNALTPFLYLAVGIGIAIFLISWIIGFFRH